MNQDFNESIIIEERRLIKTMMTGRPSATAFFVTLFTVVFITLTSLFYWKAPMQWTQLLPAAKDLIFLHAEIWRIFTAVLIHADLEHLLSNMLMLWIFSYLVFGYFGFQIFPLVSFLLAGFVNAIAVMTYPPEVQLIGASGLVYILGGFWLTSYALIQRQYPIVNRLMRVIGIALVIFVPSTFAPTTSYRTHALGFAAGVLMGLGYFLVNKRKIRSQEVFKLIPRSDEAVEDLTP